MDNPAWLEELRQIEAGYWWFVNKRRLVCQLLAAHAPEVGTLLEVGCGGGFCSSVLQKKGWRVISADIAHDSARFAHAHGIEEALVFDASFAWPLRSNVADAFIMLDVLEHLEDDVLALQEAWRVLQPGGVGIVFVPAYPFLYSDWDTYYRHYRRYTLGTLTQAAADATFVVERATYWNAVSIPPALLLRLTRKLEPSESESLHFPAVPRWINQALIGYGKMESAFIQAFPMPAGLSVAVVLRKPVPVRVIAFPTPA